MRIASNTGMVLALALTASVVQAPPALASCYAAKPDQIRRLRRDLWRESSLVFVGTVLEEGRTRTPITEPGRPDENFGSTITVQVAIDRLEKGRAPGGRRATVRYDVDTPVEDVVGCRADSVEAGQRRRFYLTPSAEAPGQYVGSFRDPREPAR
jgi:hypothetical protein